MIPFPSIPLRSRDSSSLVAVPLLQRFRIAASCCFSAFSCGLKACAESLVTWKPETWNLRKAPLHWRWLSASSAHWSAGQTYPPPLSAGTCQTTEKPFPARFPPRWNPARWSFRRATSAVSTRQMLLFSWRSTTVMTWLESQYNYYNHNYFIH